MRETVHTHSLLVGVLGKNLES